MTMQAEQLIGARVTDGDGQVVGTVQQVFNDDRDDTPVWARIRSGTRDRFVPLGGSRVSKEGLSVPFNAQQIMSGPEVSAERHMSAAQTDQLRRHFGLTVPAQGGQPDMAGETGRGEGQGGESQRGREMRGEGRGGRGDRGEGRERDEAQRGETQAGRRGDAPAGEDWLVRAEERVRVGKESRESGRARLHKYVDTEPVEQAVHVYHEEYEIERVPITTEEQIRGDIGEGELEIILHEERPVFTKETVPVERVRLVVKRVEEDRTLRDEIRKERVELDGDGDGTRRAAQRADSGAGGQRRR